MNLELNHLLFSFCSFIDSSLIDNTYVVSLFGKTFLTKVTLLDLDPKPDAHFNKYCLQTQQISDALKDLKSQVRTFTHVNISMYSY